MRSTFGEHTHIRFIGGERDASHVVALAAIFLRLPRLSIRTAWAHAHRAITISQRPRRRAGERHAI
ncbi:hypothetical protein C6Q09_17395 [Burkholderia multivorans]|nr:hypothetical protein C6Q11_07455 [Burkholderia multivorans]PRF68659.1 hypothetical protein C6Q09_17395 [Burkholderia multivorans]PRG82063.1 hypothetical protein C6T58_11195 [Burkholderia multivorans]